MINKVPYIFLMLIFCSISYGQQKSVVVAEPLVSVFFIGENEAKYEKLVQSYNEMLFTVCNNNMETAFDHWSTLLKDIEEYSLKANYDLKGVKMWMNVFWDVDGSIDYIVFYPKPNSRNLNYEKLKPILAQFILTYQSPFKHTSKFSHYGSAAFPVFGKSISGTEK